MYKKTNPVYRCIIKNINIICMKLRDVIRKQER